MIFVNGRTLSKRMVLCATGSLRFQEGKQQQQQQQKQQQQQQQPEQPEQWLGERAHRRGLSAPQSNEA